MLVVVLLLMAASFNWKSEVGVVPGRSTTADVLGKMKNAGGEVSYDTAYGSTRHITFKGTPKFLSVQPDSMSFLIDRDTLRWVDVWFELNDTTMKTLDVIRKKGKVEAGLEPNTARVCAGDDCWDVDWSSSRNILHFSGTRYD